MRGRFWLFPAIPVALLLGATAGVLHSRNQRLQQYLFHHENVLGTSLELKISTPVEEDAELAESAVLIEIDRLSSILSAWDASSEFSRWTRTHGQPVAVSPELLEVLQLYDRWQQSTNGALNAAAATANSLWRDAARAGHEPLVSELRKAAYRMQAPHWKLDQHAGTATHTDDAQLALASFTKSYIEDRAANAALASSPSIDGIVINIGGDIVVRGHTAEIIDILNPNADAQNDPGLAQVTIQDGAIATSGSYRRGVDIGGHRYSHIIDPRTARTADGVLSSTVQYCNPTTAGALATAFSVLPAEESVQIARKYRDLEYLIVKSDGTLVASNGWRHMTMPLAAAAVAMQAPARSGDWNQTFELVVNLALARVDDPRYRRPYVAVWVEDADKFPVRTLALWYEKSRWLPDLKTWYRDDRLRAMAEGTEISRSVSSATRPPGRYTLRWDGKDNAGKFAKTGRYTVCMEVAREHGTWQLVRQDMDFAGVPKQVQLPGNTEMEAVSLDYRKIAH